LDRSSRWIREPSHEKTKTRGKYFPSPGGEGEGEVGQKAFSSSFPDPNTKNPACLLKASFTGKVSTMNENLLADGCAANGGFVARWDDFMPVLAAA